MDPSSPLIDLPGPPRTLSSSIPQVQSDPRAFALAVNLALYSHHCFSLLRPAQASPGLALSRATAASILPHVTLAESSVTALSSSTFLTLIHLCRRGFSPGKTMSLKGLDLVVFESRMPSVQ